MSKPYFSIIIPARTISAQITHELLPAIAAQSYTKFEVFITPDCSSKQHIRLEKKYPWLHIIPAKENKRPGIKRDMCVKKAQARILTFIDDDAIPPKNWLKNAHNLWEKNKNIAALGGPGILPPRANYWERVFDAVLTTWMGSGEYTYRFVTEKARYVDDFPSMNLMIRKSIFAKLNGFDNGYWPGEDSKLLEKFSHIDNAYIYYHPDVAVYHHRRDTFIGHLKQHKNYGKTRGIFAAQGDTNSKHLIYFIPSLFILYSLVVAFIYFVAPSVLNIVIVPLLIYGALLFFVFIQTSVQTESILIGLSTLLVIPATHMTYGLWYMIGYTKKIMKNF